VTSIHRYLVRTLALLLTLIAALTVVAAYLIAHHELEEILDAELSLQSRIVSGWLSRGMSSEEYEHLAQRLSQPGHPALLYRDGVVMPALKTSSEPPLYHEEERKLSIGLWTADGTPRLIGAQWNDRGIFPAPQATGYRWVDYDGQRWRVFSLFDAASDTWVSMGLRQAFLLEIAERVALNNFLPMLFILPLLLWLMRRIIRRGLAPIDALSRQVENRDAVDLTFLDAEVPRELGGLRDAINDFITRLRETLERERRFTADAAHELRTPLAGLKIHLDNAQAGEGASLQKAQIGIERLQRVVEQLLVLARLDRSETLQGDDVDLYEMTAELAAELWPLAEARHQHLTLTGLTRLRVRADPVELGILLRNLIDNALRYTPEGGDIEVVLGCEQACPTLTVRDTGPGIPEAMLDTVTERFRRASDQRITGSGLGLSIVLELAKRQQACLTLANRRPHGLEARLTWAFAAPS